MEGENTDDVQDNLQGDVRDDGDAGADHDEPQDTESRLKAALNDWEEDHPSEFDDEPEPEPEPTDPDELAEFQDRLDLLEGELSDGTMTHDWLGEGIGAMQDAQRRVDDHDADRLRDYLADETGIDRHVLDLELTNKLLTDMDFCKAADDRFENPERFQAMVSEFEDGLRERHPAGDYGLSAAVMAARSASSSPDHGEFSERDWSGMSAQEFQKQSRKVLSAHKAGRLGGATKRGGGWTTKP